MVPLAQAIEVGMSVFYVGENDQKLPGIVKFAGELQGTPKMGFQYGIQLENVGKLHSKETLLNFSELFPSRNLIESLILMVLLEMSSSSELPGIHLFLLPLPE